MIQKKHLLTLLNFKKNFESLKSFVANRPYMNTRRVYHIHLMKTGGTSINNSFLNLSVNKLDDINKKSYLHKEIHSQADRRLIYNNWIYIAFNQILISLGIYHYAWSHRPYHKIYLPSNTYKITCIRNPYQRLFSRYKQLVFLYNNGKPKRTDGDHLHEYSLLGNSFEEFILNIPKKDLCHQLYMFSKNLNVEEAIENLKKVDYILDTNTISEDIKELSKILGVKMESLHLRKIGSPLDQKTKEKFKFVEELFNPEVEFYKKATELKNLMHESHGK